MNTPRKSGGRRGALVTAAVAVLLLVAGIVVGVVALRGQSPSTPAAGGSSSSVASPDVPGETRAPKAAQAPRPNFDSVLEGSPPVSMAIPRIDVQVQRFESLQLDPKGAIEVPRDHANPGWFTPGPSPGQLGPAVIAGHLDSKTGPAVFYRLSELQAGDTISIARRDGSKARFSVDRVASFEQADFPTRAVYGPTTRAELRLITCGGGYDAETGYLRNTVVFAHLV